MVENPAQLGYGALSRPSLTWGAGPGVLHDGQEVVIKNIDLSRSFNAGWIYDAINIFINLKHENIIKPMGYCHEITASLSEDEGKQIVGGRLIDWSSSFRIIQGIAQGLHYLHEQRFVHMDLKPSNILFDSHMNPRISDFGIAAKLVHVNAEKTVLDLAGTPGYIAPEYIGEGILSIKCDVYAFGIILIQTISSMNRHEYPGRIDLAGWAMVAQDSGRIMKELFGPAKVDHPQLMEIKRCIEVGVLCIQYHRHKRPTMADVLLMLSGEKEVPIPEGCRFPVPTRTGEALHS
ncbi:hypothetical protein EJB05_15510, partial [Eragrostis curvula]